MARTSGRMPLCAVLALSCTPARTVEPKSGEPPAPTASVTPIVRVELPAPSEPAPPALPPVRCNRAAESSVSRYGSSATVLSDGRVLLAGSAIHDAAGPYSSVVEVFDPATNALEKVAPLRIGRAKHAALRLADGRVLVVGGMSDEPKIAFSRSAEVFDPTQKRWRDAGPIPEGAISQALALLADGRVVLAGGDAMIKARKLAQVVVLDPKTLRWSKWPDAPSTRAGSFVALTAGRFAFVGDSSAWSGDETAEIDVLDSSTRAWSSVPSPLGAVPIHLAARSRANELAVAGWDVTGASGRARIALVNDAFADVRELPSLPTTAAVSWLAGIDGVLHVVVGGMLHRWDAARAAWSDGASIDADGCSTIAVLPGAGSRRARLLVAARCGGETALDLCDL